MADQHAGQRIFWCRAEVARRRLDLRRQRSARRFTRAGPYGLRIARRSRVPTRVPTLGERRLDDLSLGGLSPDVTPAAIFAPQRVDVETRADGSRIFRARDPLRPFARATNVALAHGAASFADRVFLAERDRSRCDLGWTTLTYGEARTRARRIAQGLLDAGASSERPVLIVAANGIAHALLTVASHEIGVPTIPVARLRRDDETSAHARALGGIVRRLGSVLAFAGDCESAGKIAQTLPGVPVVTDIATLERTPSGAVDALAASVDAATVAKIMLTSGTTGDPKGVIVTHGMIVSNQVAFSQVWPYFDREPPILVDWLPWSHSFGGNKIFNFALHRGGTLYIDDGAPTDRDFARSIENLTAIAPTAYFNVPRGYAMLVGALETDAALRACFFSRVRLAFSAAAAMPHALAERFARVRACETPRIVPLVGGWGMTETAPGATCVHAVDASARAIGVPLPGVEIMFARVDGRDELRVRGPNVTPGYARDEVATRAAFDDEAFFCSGDVATLVDDSDPDRGFLFGGRIAENFKLSSGVWVRTAVLRDALLEAAPFASEVLLLGEDADEVCALIFIDPHRACESDVRIRAARALAAVAQSAAGRSDRIARALLVFDLPDAAAGEMTPKGSLNRAVARERRARDVARLYAAGAPADPDMIFPGRPAGLGDTRRDATTAES